MATKVGDIFVRLGMDLTDFSKGLQDAKKSLKDVGNEFTSIGTSMSMAFTAPMAAIAGFAITQAAGFEASMNKVQGLLQDFSNNSTGYLQTFGNEMKDLNALAIQLGKDTQYSAKQAADAMGELAAAGFTSQQIMQGMSGVMSLAAVGQMKLAEAAEIAAAVMGGFGIVAQDMGRVADVLAKASSISAASVQDLGYSFKYVGPIARAAGISFNETAAALVVLANAGIRGEQAGTGIRNMLQDLLKPSKMAEDVINRLGITLMDAQGKVKPLADIIDQFKDKSLTLSEGMAIWGARFTEVLPLIAAGGQKIRDLTSEMDKAEGSAKKMADVFRKGVAGAWEQTKGSIETLAISMGKLMQPVVEPAIKAIEQMANAALVYVDKFQAMDASTKMWTGVLIAIPALIGPVMLGIGGIANVLSSMASGFGLAVSGIGNFATGIGNLARAIGTLPATLANIASAVSADMVGALTKGELAMLRFGQAALAVGAVFVGWQVGTWLRENVSAMKAFGDGVADLIMRVPGMESVMLKLTGASGALKTATESDTFAVKKMEEALRAHGVVVSQGALSLQDYSAKLRQMAKDIGVVDDAQVKSFASAQQGMAAVMKMQGDVAALLSKVAIGVTDPQKAKNLLFELEAEKKAILDIQAKVAAGVAAGKIGKEEQIKLERQLADAMTQTKGAIAQMNAVGQTSVGVFTSLRAAKKGAADAAKELAEADKAYLNFSLKIRDVLDSLPRTYDQYVNSAKKLKEIPKELQAQFTSLEQLKEKIRDLRIEIEKAPAGAQSKMAGALYGLEIQAKSMEGWFDTLVKKYKALEQANKDLVPTLDAVQRSMGAVSVEGLRMSPILESLTSVPNFADLPKPVIGLTEAMKAFGLSSTENLGKAAANAKEFYAAIEASSESMVVKKEALLKYLQAQIAFDQQAGNSTKELSALAKQTATELEAMGVKVKGVASETDAFSKALSNQISTILDDMGKGIADAILAGKGLGEMFKSVFEEAGKALLRFTVNYITGELMKALKGAILGVDGLNFSLTKMWEKFKSVFSSGASATGTTVDAAGNIVKAGAGTGAEAAKTGAGMMSGGLMGAITGVSSAVSAVTDVLGYLQGRRMEQDIGRIEVTSRGILNMTVAHQQTFNEYLPALQNLSYLGGMDTVGRYILTSVETIDENVKLLIPIKEILWEMLTKGVASSGGGGGQLSEKDLQRIANTKAYNSTLLEAQKAGALDTADWEKELALAGQTAVDSAEDTGAAQEDLQKSINNLGRSVYLTEGNVMQTSSSLDGYAAVTDSAALQVEALGTTIQETSQAVSSAGITFIDAIDNVASSFQQTMTEKVLPGISFQTRDAYAAATASQSGMSAGSNANQFVNSMPGIMLIPRDSKDVNLTVYTSSASGRQIANDMVTTFRLQGVDI